LKKRSVLIFLPANNFSEEEYNTSKLFLAKNDFRIFIGSDSVSLCKGDHDLKVKADVSLFNIHPENFSALILIGGAGVRAYWNNLALMSITKKFNEQNKIIGAICAAPVVLAKAGILNNQKSACFPADKNEMQKFGAIYSEEKIVVSENVVTASDISVSQEFIEKVIYHVNRTEIDH